TLDKVDKSLAKAFADVRQAIERNKAKLQNANILSVRPGFQFRDGWITRTPAIVVTVKRKTAAVVAQLKLPSQLGGIPVDVRPATPAEQLAALNKTEAAAANDPDAPALPDWEHDAA